MDTPHQHTSAGQDQKPDGPAAAREALLALCWPDGTKCCPRCQTANPYTLAGGRLRCGSCRYTFHDFTGRWLNETGLSALQWLGLVDAFAEEKSTREAASLVGISYNTAFKALTVLRLAILAQGADAAQLLGGRSRLPALLETGRAKASSDAQPGTSPATLPVYGLMSRGRHVFVDLAPELSAESVLHFNHNFHLRVSRHGSILVTDRYKSYDALVLCGDDSLPYHYLLRQTGLPYAESGGCPFWDFALPRLRQFKGLSSRRFPLYLKELALRFNQRGEDLTPTLLACLCAPVPKFAQSSLI